MLMFIDISMHVFGEKKKIKRYLNKYSVCDT